MKTAKRLLSEFWIPLIIAVLWTIYNAFLPSETSSFTKWINLFGPSFFLCSYVSGNIVRVKRQQAAEEKFVSIETRIESVLERLDKHAKDFLGYATGAGGFAKFIIFKGVIPNTITLQIINMSDYPVFDFYSEVIDLDEPVDLVNGKLWTRHRFELPYIYGHQTSMNPAYTFSFGDRKIIPLNVFLHGRALNGVQEIRVAKVDTGITWAMRITNAGEIVECTVPDNFPGFDPVNVDAAFNLRG